MTQPLPVDLRNQSFRGLNCEGWDFSGRDVRGCNFRNAKLKGANFSRAIAGRSKKQIVIRVGSALAGALILALLLPLETAILDTPLPVGEGEGSVEDEIIVAFARIVAAVGAALVAIVGAVAVGGAGAFALAGAAAAAAGGAGAVLKVPPAFSRGATLTGIFWSILAFILLAVARYLAREVVREFKKATGTDFEGADLQGVNFSHATLNNCNFTDADTKYINWSRVEGDRSTLAQRHQR